MAAAKNQNNYNFAKTDRDKIILWMFQNLRADWRVCDPAPREFEKRMIAKFKPIINTKHNPDAIAELAALRLKCRTIARNVTPRAHGLTLTAPRSADTTIKSTPEQDYPSVFHKLISKEDHYTQLLCNAMLRFPDIGHEVLDLFHLSSGPERAGVGKIRIATQVSLATHGRPDAVMRRKGLIMLLEVKMKHRRGPTPNQGFDITRLSGYSRYLQNTPEKARWLVYLVPKRWEHLGELRNKLNDQNAHLPTIQTNVTFWEDAIQSKQHGKSSNHYFRA